MNLRNDTEASDFNRASRLAGVLLKDDGYMPSLSERQNLARAHLALVAERDEGMREYVRIHKEKIDQLDMRLVIEARRNSLFYAIAHGDDKHRAWLKQAIEDHFAGRPVQRETLAAQPNDVVEESDDHSDPWILGYEQGHYDGWFARERKPKNKKDNNVPLRREDSTQVRNK